MLLGCCVTSDRGALATLQVREKATAPPSRSVNFLGRSRVAGEYVSEQAVKKSVPVRRKHDSL